MRQALKKRWLAAFLLVALAGVATAPAYTIYAGLTLDVHQDVPDGSLPGGRLPNDFHVEGTLCTSSGVAPVLVNHLDDIFPHFQYSLTPLGGCWWRVTADWWLDPTMPGIPYCYVAHLGLLFQVEDHNVVIDLVGWWTLDGVRVGDIHGGYANGGFVPIPGFDVTPLPEGQVLRIGNGTIPPIEPPIPPVPPSPWPIPIELVELELMAVPPSFLPPEWFQELRLGGAQEQWPWIAVADPAGNDIGRQNPVPMGPDSFFDVFLNAPVGGGQFAPVQTVVINPGDLLLVRSQRMFINNAGQPDPNMGLWEWHIHEAQGPEACCFPDGSCRDLAARDCTVWGGFPMGMGTRCATTICPGAELGACCYGQVAIQCVITDPLTCQQQLNGQWMGPGTTCDDLNGNNIADICEGPVELGACCYGIDVILCAITDPLTCEQQLNGQWMGPGTTCDDWNGNGVADICESAPYYIEFSVDIGSDRELSDPFRDGDEGFDPGDVYWWRSAPVDYPGRDGFKDDLRIFGFDPPPTPPDPNYMTAVPVGHGNYENYHEFFDLDGHDQIDVNLIEFFPPGQPLPGPIPMFPSQCIHPPVHVLVSFDDDMAPGWPAWDVPVTVPSPAGNVYGTTGGRNEAIGVVLNPAVPMPPFPLVGMYRFVDEIGVHQSLAPNPDLMFEEDDDVDSLDIVPGRDACPFWYFTADAEAHLGLLPGGVYLVTPMGPQLVIDPSIHLGLPPDVDLDAIEFTWLREQTGAVPFLALVFSVDEDDPLTPWDESGGLPPNMLFGSYLLGWHFPLSDPLPDDIDAVTIWRESLRPICRGDANCDGVISWRDIDFFVAAMNDNVVAWEAMFAPGAPSCPFANNDVNGDGTVSWRDIDPLVAVMNTVCP